MRMQVYNYPVVNHGRARGLLQRLRSRLLTVQGERAALQQLSDIQASLVYFATAPDPGPSVLHQ